MSFLEYFFWDGGAEQVKVDGIVLHFRSEYQDFPSTRHSNIKQTDWVKTYKGQ